jgi:hypothetical protein
MTAVGAWAPIRDAKSGFVESSPMPVGMATHREWRAKTRYWWYWYRYWYSLKNNLTIRQFLKWFARLSLGFSKKLANLETAVAIHVVYFNFCWRPRENRGRKLRPTPALMANRTPTVWSFDGLYDAVMA